MQALLQKLCRKAPGFSRGNIRPIRSKVVIVNGYRIL